MESYKCPSCGLLNLAGAPACRRCNATLASSPVSAVALPPTMGTPSTAGRLLVKLIGGVVALALGVTAGSATFTWCRNGGFSYSPDWRDVSPPGAGFTVSMPGPPKESNETLPTAIGDVQLRSFTVEFGSSGEFAAATFSLPAQAGQASSADTVLDGMANGAVTQSKSRLVSKEPISLGRFQGLEVVAAPPGPANALMVMRMYWIPPNHALSLAVVGMSAGRLLGDRDQMFRSLQIDDGR